MGWLRDRFSRTYAYHYHKKAAQKAMKKHSAAADGDTPPALVFPESGTTFCYERVVGENDIHYQAQIQLTLTPAVTTSAAGTSSSSGSTHPSERYQYILTGKGTETCTSDNVLHKSQSNSFIIRDGRLAVLTGLFYWTEVRPLREKHLVVGTLQRDHWDETLWSVEDAYYVKRFDVEKCGVPADGDIRETILSFSSVVPTPQTTKTNVEENETNTKEESSSKTTSDQLDQQAATANNDENEDTTTTAQDSTGETITGGNDGIDKEAQKSIKDDENDTEKATIGVSAEIRDEEQPPSTDRKQEPSAAAPEANKPVDLDESVSGHDEANDNPASGSSPERVQEAVNTNNDDPTPGPNNVVPALDSTSPVQDQIDEQHSDENDIDGDINDDNIADIVPEDCVITSLLPHIREARSLIDKILGKEETSAHPKGLTINTSVAELLPQIHSDDPSLMVDFNALHGDKDELTPIAVTIDKSVFREEGDEDEDEHDIDEGKFVFDEAAFRESDEEEADEEENFNLEMVLSEESLKEEKEVLHTEVQRINKTFELLSSQHNGKYKVGRV
uniref:Uncharacterized protein n=1 Tax=Amphora coffeiformis TaxID=265554 RepID=A0A7S3LES3_9STRA